VRAELPRPIPEPSGHQRVELGEAHRHGDVAAKLLDAGQFDRVLASLHTLPLASNSSCLRACIGNGQLPR
jgi:hypothetical protein